MTQLSPKSSTAAVTVFIRDDNDNVPQFSEERYVVSDDGVVREPAFRRGVSVCHIVIRGS